MACKVLKDFLDKKEIQVEMEKIVQMVRKDFHEEKEIGQSRIFRW